jgi:uncharacterized protein YgfB (UPF0149 family)
MTRMREVSYTEFAKAVARARLGIDAAELHGSAAGYLCAGGGGDGHVLLSALRLESDDAGALDPLHALLDELAAGMSRDLGAGEALAPLLPEAALAARADGMVDWCRGFLGGLGLTGALEGSALDAGTRELLDAFGQIASMRIECDEGDEGALDDVLEFIRGGTVQLHARVARAVRR